MNPEQLAGGRYEVLELLDEDGISQVFRARDNRLGIERVVKLLKVESPATRAQLREDLERLRQLDHPHIVPVHEVGEAYGSVFVVSSVMERGSVEDHMLERGPLHPEQAVAVALGVLDGLAAAHAAGVVHQRFGPEHVLIDSNGDVRVADFGVARVDGLVSTAAGASLDPSDPRADIFAVGAMLVSLLGGTADSRKVPSLLLAFVQACRNERDDLHFASAMEARAALAAIEIPAAPPSTPPLGRARPEPAPGPSALGDFRVPDEEVDWDDVDPEAKTVLSSDRRVLVDGPTEPTRTNDAFEATAEAMFGPDEITQPPKPIPPPPAPVVTAPAAAVPEQRTGVPDWVWIFASVSLVLVVAAVGIGFVLQRF